MFTFKNDTASKTVLHIMLSGSFGVLLAIPSLASHAKLMTQKSATYNATVAIKNQTNKAMIFLQCSPNPDSYVNSWNSWNSWNSCKSTAVWIPAHQTKHVASMYASPNSAMGLLALYGPKGPFAIGYKFNSSPDNSYLQPRSAAYTFDATNCKNSGHGIMKCCTYSKNTTETTYSYNCTLPIVQTSAEH